MPYDLIVPFGILLALVIYLIFTRNSFEKDVVELYEKKFDEWKKHVKIEENREPTRELMGLVFKKGYKAKYNKYNRKFNSYQNSYYE